MKDKILNYILNEYDNDLEGLFMDNLPISPNQVNSLYLKYWNDARTHGMQRAEMLLEQNINVLLYKG